MRHAARLHALLGISLLAGALAVITPAPAAAAEDKRACCRILRVDLEKSTAWLRNPRTGLVVQFRLDAEGRERFKVGDLFNPETNEHEGEKLQKTYALGLPDLPEPNAHLLRVRGHEIAAKDNVSDTVYRFRTLKFDNILSSLRPGDGVYVDVEAGWVFINFKAYGKIKPSVWAYKLE